MNQQLINQLSSMLGIIFVTIIEYHVVKKALKDFFKEKIIKEEEEK